MRHTTYLVTAAALVAVAIGPGTSLRAADLKLPDPSPATPNAANLVEQALQSELAGDADQRAVLLKQALELDPNYAPARWHSGFVQVAGKWLSLDEAAQRAAADPQLAAYRKRRDALVDTADNQREIARWCKKHKLTDEERIHWAKVLEFDSQDAEALAGLNVEFYQGQLLTKSQMIEAKKRAGERMKAIRQWQPKLAKWRKAIESGHVVDRQAALEGLRKFNEPNALAAVEAVFAVDEDSERGRELNKLLNDTVGRIQHPEATRVLLRRALVPDSETIRAAACDELKKRSMHAYVPQLIALMPEQSSWNIEWHVVLYPFDLAALHIELTRNVGAREHQSSVDITSGMIGRREDSHANQRVASIYPIISVFNGFEQSTLEFRQTDLQRDRIKEKVRFALTRATGFDNVDDIQLWKRQWNEFNGWETEPSLESGRTRTTDQVTINSVIARPAHSCFPAGTPVWTENGLRTIENVRAGDRVIAQNTTTGEIAYKSVQATTLRPTTSMISISIRGGSLQTTDGHPFWVNGTGWMVAKQLRDDQVLHGLRGPAEIDAISDAPDSEAYNLVVSDFHTYFVGEHALLVHDNSPIVETSVDVPGLTARMRTSRRMASQ